MDDDIEVRGRIIEDRDLSILFQEEGGCGVREFLPKSRIAVVHQADGTVTEKKLVRMPRELAAAFTKSPEQRKMEREQTRLSRELREARAKSEWEMARSRLRLEMTKHLGKNNAIGADALFEIVFEHPHVGNKMTGCRLLRKLIAEEKYGPAKLFIASSCCTIRPGYYIPITDSERRAYVARRKNKLKRDIGRLASLDEVNAGAYTGQLALEMQETQFPEGV